jgi:hypothetical protein
MTRHDRQALLPRLRADEVSDEEVQRALRSQPAHYSGMMLLGVDAAPASGGGGGFTDPTSIAGLQLWLKADAGVQNDAGSTPANGGSVKTWKDQSGNTDDATAAIAGEEPLYATGVLNSKPMLGGNGGVTFLDLASAVALTGPFTLYVVGERTSGTIWVPLANGSTHGAVLIFSDNNLYVINDGNSFVNTGVVATGGFAFRLRRDASNVVKYCLTGGTETTVGTQSGTFTLGEVLGRSSDSQYTGSAGLVGEVALYSVATTGTDDGNMSTYLSGRWGVSLP